MGIRAGFLLLYALFSLLLLVDGPPVRADDEAPAYIALGDSLAFGVGAANPAAEGYVGLTHFALSDEDGLYSGDLDLVNLSEPGATSGDLLLPEGQLERALEEISNRAQDDVDGNEVVLISIDVGGNDLLQLADPDSPCLSDTGSTRCREAINDTLSGLQDNLGEILGRLRMAAPDARMYAINLYNPYSGTGDTREVLASVAVQQINGVINATASGEEYSTTLVPIFELFLGRGDQWIASDRIHPNNSGHIVMSEALLAAIEGRPVDIPADLESVPTGPATNNPGVTEQPGSGDGVSETLLVVAVAVAFLGGIAVSLTYFWARGRQD